ncbi:MAG TPA: hypothetical protein VMS98_18655 [Thermoanaerobaculia bacterium]|nr:hypothetical protein [Thermoanaerobaculia bacterium]
MGRAARVAVLLLLALWAEAADRAVLIYPKERPWFRRVFYTSHQRELRAQLQSRFAIEVHNQVATAEELLGIDVSGTRLLVISAHGDPFALFLGADGRRTLDARDIGRLRNFFARLAPDATIVLQSCHNGRGFAWAVKEAAGPHRRVIAAKGVIPPDGLTITSLDPIDVRITCRGRSGPWDCTIRL